MESAGQGRPKSKIDLVSHYLGDVLAIWDYDWVKFYRECFEKSEQPLSEILGLSVGQIEALISETPVIESDSPRLESAEDGKAFWGKIKARRDKKRRELKRGR